MKKVEKIIKAIRESDEYIGSIYTKGGCYQFHKILLTIDPYAVAYFSYKKQHVITLIKGVFYDINGVYHDPEADGFQPMTLSQHREAKYWKFSKSMVLSIGECPFCGEPLTF